MDLQTLSDDRLRRELKEANENYTRHMSRIPAHAWQFEPYKTIKGYLERLRKEWMRRKSAGAT